MSLDGLAAECLRWRGPWLLSTQILPAHLSVGCPSKPRASLRHVLTCRENFMCSLLALAPGWGLLDILCESHQLRVPHQSRCRMQDAKACSR